MPASAVASITLVAKPVVTEAAMVAHFSFWAVIRTLPAQSGNISAKVSMIWSLLPEGLFTLKIFAASSYLTISSLVSLEGDID